MAASQCLNFLQWWGGGNTNRINWRGVLPVSTPRNILGRASCRGNASGTMAWMEPVCIHLMLAVGAWCLLLVLGASDIPAKLRGPLDLALRRAPTCQAANAINKWKTLPRRRVGSKQGCWPRFTICRSCSPTKDKNSIKQTSVSFKLAILVCTLYQ